MKRLIIASTLLLSFCLATFADNTGKEPVILSAKTYGTESEHPEPPRAPMRVPSLYIEDHTLSFSSACVGYTLQLVQDDEVVYTYYIQDSDDLDLPSNLIGEYEICLVGETFTFVGEIEL